VRLLAILLVCLSGWGCRSASSASDAKSDDAQASADRALIAQFDEAVPAAQNTPSMEVATHPLDNPQLRQKMLRQLPATEAELAFGRSYYREILNATLKGPTWPQPPTVDLPRAAVAPVIDGRLDDPAWQRAASFEQSYPFNQTASVGVDHTRWMVTWDHQHLYFAFQCRDEDLRAPVMPRDEQVYNGDCVEMFILPRPETMVYWEVVISPSGCVYDGLQAKRPRGWGAVTRPELNLPGLRFGIAVDGTLDNAADRDGGYSVEVAVPFASLPEYSLAKPAAGQVIRFMLVRVDLSGPGAGQMKPFAFVPLLSWGHNIWNHAAGRLVEAAGESAR
jgi:hypothetical protein